MATAARTVDGVGYVLTACGMADTSAGTNVVSSVPRPMQQAEWSGESPKIFIAVVVSARAGRIFESAS